MEIYMTKHKARPIALFTAIAVLSSLFAACTKPKASPEDILNLLTNEEAQLPTGRIYSSEAPEGSDGFLSEDILTVSYGFPESFDGLSSAAIRLSSYFHPCEFAVFLCKSANDAEDVALFCRNRIDTLRKYTSSSAELCSMSTEEYSRYINNAAVVISGRYVALIISSDTRALKRLFLRSV